MLYVLHNHKQGHNVCLSNLPDRRWGPLVNARFAWVWMESPNLYISVLCWIWGDEKCRQSLVNRILLGLFVGHYINRALIYPLRMQGGRPMPISVMLMAQVSTMIQNI